MDLSWQVRALPPSLFRVPTWNISCCFIHHLYKGHLRKINGAWMSQWVNRRGLDKFHQNDHGIQYLQHFRGLQAGAKRGFLAEARADMIACQISTLLSSHMLVHPEMSPTDMASETQWQWLWGEKVHVSRNQEWRTIWRVETRSQQLRERRKRTRPSCYSHNHMCNELWTYPSSPDPMEAGMF